MSGLVLTLLVAGLAAFLVLFGRKLWMTKEEHEVIKKNAVDEAAAEKKRREW